jgi:hypothetical protein
VSWCLGECQPEFTNSPIHQFTNSPTHQVTNCCLHQVTNCLGAGWYEWERGGFVVLFNRLAGPAISMNRQAWCGGGR